MIFPAKPLQNTQKNLKVLKHVTVSSTVNTLLSVCPSVRSSSHQPRTQNISNMVYVECGMDDSYSDETCSTVITVTTIAWCCI